jgi:hypothetical protein
MSRPRPGVVNMVFAPRRLQLYASAWLIIKYASNPLLTAASSY